VDFLSYVDVFHLDLLHYAYLIVILACHEYAVPITKKYNVMEDFSMGRTRKNCYTSLLRHHVLVWSVLCFLIHALFPAMILAQQPTVILSAVSGSVLVNGQTEGEGALLQAGDTIETAEGSSVVLQFSDGSSLEIGENTKLALDELSQTAANARISQIKLIWGWIRGKLSPGHQEEGSSFDIETPNALIGVKFSQPDIEVSYNPSTQETIGIAHTVELIAKNLLTDEELLVPVGSTVIVVGTTIKIVAGILSIVGTSEATTGAATATEQAGTAGSGSATTGQTGSPSSGMGTGTKVLLGVGAAAAVGGGVALGIIAANAEEETPASFTGTFVSDTSRGNAQYHIDTYSFVENDTGATGTYEFRGGHVDVDCTTYHLLNINGILDGRQLMWSWPSREDCCSCYHLGTCCTRVEGGSYSATLSNDGSWLTVSGPSCSYPNSQNNVDYTCVGALGMPRQ
jgi:hypothetical protein